VWEHATLKVKVAFTCGGSLQLCNGATASQEDGNGMLNRESIIGVIAFGHLKANNTPLTLNGKYDQSGSNFDLDDTDAPLQFAGDRLRPRAFQNAAKCADFTVLQPIDLSVLSRRT